MTARHHIALHAAGIFAALTLADVNAVAGLTASVCTAAYAGLCFVAKLRAMRGK